MKDHILDTSGELWAADWHSGLGSVPVGITTFAVNCMERSHLTHKWLMDGDDEDDKKDLANTMVKVGQTSHMEGQYMPLGELDVLYFTQIH